MAIKVQMSISVDFFLFFFFGLNVSKVSEWSILVSSWEGVLPQVWADFISAGDKCEPLSQVGGEKPVYLKGNFCRSKGQVLSLFLQDPGRKLLLRLEVQQGRREDDTHSIHKDVSGVLGSISGLSIDVKISNVW